MNYDPEAARIARLADQRVADLNVPIAERAAARKAEVERIKAEEARAQASKAAARAKADAEAERARVAAVVKAGSDMGRPRQALRLALAGPVTEAQARAIIGGLPLDADAEPTPLPAPGTHGTPGAVEERKRLAAIFANPAAECRFNAACALALQGDAPASAVMAVLSSLPPEAAPRTAAEILMERAEGLAEFGADHSAGTPRADRVATGWMAAVQKANASIGATTAPAGGMADG